MKELKMYQQPLHRDTGMLDVGSGPHLRIGDGLSTVHQRWLIALLPALLGSLYLFGFASLRVFGLTLLFALFFDLLAEKFAPSRDLSSNWSTVVLAIIFSFMLPVNAPWWLIGVGCFFMIIVGKKLFGGVGAYPAHPAALSIAILQLSWPARMDHTDALKGMDWQITLIEPLRLLKSIGSSAQEQYQLLDLFLGRQAAGSAEGLVFLILIGGLFLLFIREIQWQLPIGFLVGLMGSSFLFNLYDPNTFGSPLFYLLSGGTLFMGLFLITDHTTSPVNRTPMFIYGFIAGILLILIRGYSKHVDGIVFAVLLANLCSPLLDMMKPKVEGVENE
ncbi:MAG: hypothetical protein D6B25_10195 [Desulfobulbaceae bacterium]|nr:MAG: hypothetical protein D6B25_10195 [Desulfobulbaceae bacterium]